MIGWLRDWWDRRKLRRYNLDHRGNPVDGGCPCSPAEYSEVPPRGIDGPHVHSWTLWCPICRMMECVPTGGLHTLREHENLLAYRDVRCAGSGARIHARLEVHMLIGN